MDQPASPPAPGQQPSAAARALAAAGDTAAAKDIGALDEATAGADRKLGAARAGLVERLIYGPPPASDELGSGARLREAASRGRGIVDAALDCLARGEAFTADGRLSTALRQTLAREGAYGYTVPAVFGGRDGSYNELAAVEEALAANGLGALAVELSGQLTIGAGSLLGYGNDAQKSLFLPLVAEGRLMAFALTEVGVGVNAKKVRAYVEPDDAAGGWRLFATGARDKLWITSARHGGLVGVVARIGQNGDSIGLFVVELPERDVDIASGETDYGFSCRPSGVDAFRPNVNSRLSFENFPIPAANRIPAEGVEVLFYCLRMGRCMLASMAAGYQRMFAADAAYYAVRRDGVGGRLIRHELPRLALGRMLGGALMSRSLAHLALEQDAAGVSLAGLRDITKSAAARAALDSLVAAERVLGGRSFDSGSRVNDSRPNMHLFGVVEGENDLILMGMVKDVTAGFVDRYLAGLLEIVRSLNLGADGAPLPAAERLLRITPATFLHSPVRATTAVARLIGAAGTWRLVGWVLAGLGSAVLRLPAALVPASLQPRYAVLPRRLRRPAKAAERGLRRQRWTYLGMNLVWQLELTRAQIPLQRLGRRIELYVAALALCHHARAGSESDARVAALQAELLLEEARSIRILSAVRSIGRLRRTLAEIAGDIENGSCDLIANVAPQPFAHPWDEPEDGTRRGA